MTRILLIPLAALNMVAALAVGVHSLIVPEGGAAWVGLKLFVSLSVVVSGLLTLTQLSSRSGGSARQTALLLTGIYLVGIGAASSAWTVHPALTSGDFEGWVMLASAAILGQGVLTIWRVWTHRAAAVTA